MGSDRYDIAEEIAAAMAFLASPAASSIGTTLTVNGEHVAPSLSRATENKGDWKDESYSLRSVW
jgi:hypothetical protein